MVSGDVLASARGAGVGAVPRALRRFSCTVAARSRRARVVEEREVITRAHEDVIRGADMCLEQRFRRVFDIAECCGRAGGG